jgi:hypothetical protein
VSVVCCQVEVSATGWSLVQRSPTECGVSEYDSEASKNEEAQAHIGLSSHRKKNYKHLNELHVKLPRRENLIASFYGNLKALQIKFQVSKTQK